MQDGAPANLRALLAVLTSATDPTLHARLQRLIAQTALPERNLTEPVLGVKTAFHLGKELDLAQYYQYGFDGPGERRARAGRGHGERLSDLAPLLSFIDAGGKPIEALYLRRHHVGLDVTGAWGSVVVRADAAFDSRKVFYQTDFTSFDAPVVQGVLGLEYQSGDPEKILLVEGYGLVILRDTPALLFYDRQTVGVSNNT